VHPAGFIIRNYQDARSPERKKIDENWRKCDREVCSVERRS